jgi:hypothetical protein
MNALCGTIFVHASGEAVDETPIVAFCNARSRYRASRKDLHHEMDLARIVMPRDAALIYVDQYRVHLDQCLVSVDQCGIHLDQCCIYLDQYGVWLDQCCVGLN